jgi:hypothetical protein
MNLSSNQGTSGDGKGNRRQAFLASSIILGLIAICLVTAWAVGCSTPPANQKLPEIFTFTGEPSSTDESSFVEYTYSVRGASHIKLVEANDIIAEIDIPPSASSDGKGSDVAPYTGTASGKLANVTRKETGELTMADATLIATNEQGQVEQGLTQSGPSLLRPVGWVHDCTPPCRCITPGMTSSQGMTTQCSTDPCARAVAAPFGLFKQDRYCYRYPCEWGGITIRLCGS